MPNAESIPPPADAADVVPRQRVADPDFWLTLAAWTLIGFSSLQILLFSFGRDQGIYALIGEGILHGKMPYRDLWDFKPPGIFLLFGLAQGLLGKSMLSIRLLEVAGLIGVVFAMRRLADAFFGEPRVGVLAGAVAVYTHAGLEFWHTAQPEAFGGFLIVYALALATADTAHRRRWLVWAGVGALFGAAFVLKPTLGGGIFVCAAYLARRELVRAHSWRAAFVPLAAVALASLAPILLCAAWLALGGAWGAFRWTMFDFTPGYSAIDRTASAPEAFYYGLVEFFTRFSPLGLFGVIAAITLRPMHGREREGLMAVLGVISINIAGVAMQNKFFAYHYSSTLPLLGFMAGLGYYKLWRRLFSAGYGGVVAYASFLLVALNMRPMWMDLAGTFWSRSAVRMKYLFRASTFRSRAPLDAELYHVADYDLAEDREVAREIRGRVPENTPVFVWGFEPVIYWLSESPPSSRFIYDVPQRVQWQRDEARRMLMTDLGARPPEIIVVQRGDIFRWVTGNYDDSAAALRDFPELEQLVESGYTLATSLRDFDIYERRKAPLLRAAAPMGLAPAPAFELSPEDRDPFEVPAASASAAPAPPSALPITPSARPPAAPVPPPVPATSGAPAVGSARAAQP